jgi:nucleoside-diphosphate-sugar epimerase
MKILITGSTGYIGSCFVKFLESYDFEIFQILRSDNYSKDANIFSFHSVSEIPKIVENIKPNIVFHFAAAYNNLDIATEAASMVESNVLFGTQILNFLGPNTKFVYFSSYMQYAGPSFNQNNFYTLTKSTFNLYANYFAKTKNLHIREIILSDVYGLGDTRNKVITRLVSDINQFGNFFPNNPDGRVMPIFIEDVLQLLLSEILIDSERLACSIHLNPKWSYAISDIVEYFKAIRTESYTPVLTGEAINLVLPEGTLNCDISTSLEVGLKNLLI